MFIESKSVLFVLSTFLHCAPEKVALNEVFSSRMKFEDNSLIPPTLPSSTRTTLYS